AGSISKVFTANKKCVICPPSSPVVLREPRREQFPAFWAKADTHLALTSSFVEIARLLSIPEAKDQEDTVMAVKRWLETNNGWLLIMDNADDPELTKGFFPRNHNGRILLTSRAQLFDTIGIAKPLELDVMLPSEAVDFFFKRTERDSRSSDERNAASKLGEELGYLPLALEQAGAYIAAKKVSFSVY